jgi:putative solute:sodium symporter small subunit
MQTEQEKKASDYWGACLRILAVILSIWFVAAYVCGILCREWMDANFPSIGHAPFGFWMAQQGSILVFVILLLVYRTAMNRLDEKHEFGEEAK